MAEPPVLVAQLAGLVLPVLKLAEPPTPSTGSSPVLVATPHLRNRVEKLTGETAILKAG